MATRLIGTDDADPRQPADVITATQGTTAADFAPGDILDGFEPGGGDGTSVVVHPYTDEADARPDVDVVFWVPTPVTLGNPFAAVEGDCVLRTSENPVQGVTESPGWRQEPPPNTKPTHLARPEHRLFHHRPAMTIIEVTDPKVSYRTADSWLDVFTGTVTPIRCRPKRTSASTPSTGGNPCR